MDRRIEEIEEEETRAGLVADRPTLVAAYQQAEEDLRQHTTIISRSAPALSKEAQVKKSLLLQIAMVNRRCKELSKALQLKVREMNQLGKQAINPTVLTLIAQEEEECAELATELKKEESHLKNLKDALRAQ